MNIYSFSAIFAFAVNLFLGLIVLFNNPRERRNIIYSIFCLFVSIWALCCFFQIIASSYDFALAIDKILFSFAVFSPALFVDFINSYTKNISKKSLSIIYLFSFFLLLVNYSQYFRMGMSHDLGFRFITIPGIGWYLFNGLYVFCAVLGLLKLYFAIKKQEGYARNQLFWLFVAFIVLILGGSSYLLFSFDIKIPPIDNWLNLLSGTMVTITILKHRLMDISVIIGRTAAYVITIAIFGAGYLLLTLIYVNLFSARVDTGFLGMTIVYGILVGEFFQRVRFLVQTSAEKAFLKGKYDYRKILSRMSKKLSGCRTMGDIVKIINTDFINEIEARSVRIYLVNEK